MSTCTFATTSCPAVVRSNICTKCQSFSCLGVFDCAACGANAGWTARGEAAWLAEVEGGHPEADAAAKAKAGRAAQLAGGGGGRGGGKKKKGKKKHK